MTNKERVAPTVELALLGFVRRGPIHGYEIHHLLSKTPELRLIWRIKQSRLYAMLDRLERSGYLEAAYIPQDGRPPRKVLHLTTAGERAYHEWLERPVAHPREMRLEFMLKLYFAGQDGPEAELQLIEQQIEVCAEWLATQKETARPDDSPFIGAVRRYRSAHIGAIYDWLASLRKEF